MAKILHQLTRDQLPKLAYVVTNPPYGARTVPPDISEQRKSLFLKIVDGAEFVGNGEYNFENVKPRDLILKNSEWNTLKEAFKTAHYPTVGHEIEADQLEELVKEAADYKDK